MGWGWGEMQWPPVSWAGAGGEGLSFRGNLGERKVGVGGSHGWLPGGGEEGIRAKAHLP